MLLEKYTEVLEKSDPIKFLGVITRVQGLLIESDGPQAVLGEMCLITINRDGREVPAEVVGVEGHTVQLMPYEETEGIEAGCRVKATGEYLEVPVSDKLLGRVLGSRGRPIDGGDPVGSPQRYPVFNKPPDPLRRRRITEQLVTGVRSIDGLLSVGKGQRVGIFAGSGVGKSTLLGMVARNTEADINVIALIGERGREVREFIENDLGPEGLKRSVLIVSSSNEPALSRIRGAYIATAVAEYFRDQGKDVMLLFDSVTRFAQAQRDIGLAIGEPPARQGYTPSVFSLLPKLLERSGTSDKGTVTAFYTILVEGDDMNEPVSDAVRGILDGHVSLSRLLAQEYHYPAIDVLDSVSRLAPKITTPRVQEAAGLVRRHMAVYKEQEDLINVGAYVRGSNPQVDEAIEKMPAIREFLTQGTEEKTDLKEAFEGISRISGVPLEAGDYSEGSLQEIKGDETLSIQA